MNGGDNPPENQLRRNWTELPDDATASILSRLRLIDVFRAQRVCGVWRRICSCRLTWTRISLCTDLCKKPTKYYCPCRRYFTRSGLESVARQIVDRSSGTLVDINLSSKCRFGVVTDDLLRYIVQSSKQIKRLVLKFRYDGITEAGLRSVAPDLCMLEELEISFHSKYGSLACDTLELVGRSCPLLKSFNFSTNWSQLYYGWRNGVAHAIAGTMHGLQHLTLDGNSLDEEGLVEILDSCPRLESLHLTRCFHIDFDEDLDRRCQRFKGFQKPKRLLYVGYIEV